MDTTDNIIYRDFLLNDISVHPEPNGLAKGMSGSVIDEFDPDDLDVVQFSEKRAETDGMDVGTPFLGARRIRMSGTIYGKTRALCYDLLFQLRKTLSSTSANRDEPADKGYQPLYFTVPTNNTTDFPSGRIAMRALAMPRAFKAPINRDAHGGDADDPLAISWSSVMVMKDPNFEGELPIDINFPDTPIVTGATAAASTDLVTKTAHGLSAGQRIYFTTLTGGTGLAVNTAYYVLASGLTADAFKVALTAGGAAINITVDYSNVEYALYQIITGNWTNRGTYSAPLNMLIAVGAQSGTITVVAGNANFNISIPASTGTRLIRIKRDKLITVQDPWDSGAETLRRSWLTISNADQWPLIPPGESPYTISVTGAVLDPGTIDGSHMWFWEQYA